MEGIATEADLERLHSGILLHDGPTLPAQVRLIPEPADLWPRKPPIRFRKSIPTVWIELILREGRNRQVRRMAAVLGHPTLRLIRWQIGDWTLAGLQPGKWHDASR